MRTIIIDSIRRRCAERRGGPGWRIDLSDDMAAEPASADAEILSVHQALDRLEAMDSRLARVVEMRYFGGMSEPEIASALGLTERTVRRDWRKARLLLAQALG
jgi:RNA polymerase sigma factor (TIGR02999 family)